ncbi:reprolysin-like metallopeptidase [Algibacter pectinivorans]|uniref:Por secretion system C-terminal sorting domain-containing protein n=1 Tax=Algibacter pectinivorans TaxID=870482 RepID=A0A1I1QUZ1_9FLAO|nr:zinc-dependent metalloprotease family protein [Algibacter pectinivorans]SFD25964.1 Por secretion system C-terminal sorting domain-containing protein [Algibacter pectinivorans]
MKLNFHFVISIFIALCFFKVTGQNNLYFKLETKEKNSKIATYSYSYYELNAALNSQNINTQPRIIHFPNAVGKLERFKITELSIMPNSMQKKYPQIKSYVGYSIDNPSNYLRFSLSPYKGLSGILLGNNLSAFYQTDSELKNKLYILNPKTNNIFSPFSCKTSAINNYSKENAIAKTNTSNKKTYTIAISTTGEYAAYHGNSIEEVNAAIVASLTNINAVFERDLNLSFVLSELNDSVIYLDKENDPYSNFSADYGDQLQQNLDATIGSSNYDLGHLLSAIGVEGRANCIGCICINNQKGRAYSSSNTPEGFYFDFSILAHEIGHQLGANHTWTSGGNERTGVQVEPGSGSTIMGYSGLAKSANIKLANDAYFHGISIEQIKNTINTSTCGTASTINDTNFTVNTPKNLILPIGTPFKLEALADNINNYSYCWEQINQDEAQTVYPNPNLGQSNAVLFRSFPPNKNPTRYFPNLKDLRFGLNKTQWEKIPLVSRTIDFRITVRDNNVLNQGTTFKDIKVTFDATYGPFEIINFANENLILEKNSEQTIKWHVNNTNKINGAETLNLLLSTNGGISYDEVIAKNISNNGSYTFKIPNVSSPKCRFMLEASNHNFFAINKKNIGINVGHFKNCTIFKSQENLNLELFDDAQNLPYTKTHSITIPDSVIISDINIGVNITHPKIGDLNITVTNPKGLEITLKTRRSCSDEKDLITTFNDEAINFNCLESDSNKHQKSLNDELKIFNNEEAQGTWTIKITDIGIENYGVLNSWFIELCTQEEKAIVFNDKDFKDFTVFPNPNNGSFHLKAKAIHPIKSLIVDIFSTGGQLIYSKVIPETTFLNQKFNDIRLQSGMYFLRITDSNTTYLKKIIVY